LGNTMTHLALDEARRWLAGQPQRRRVGVLLTDGRPDSPPLCTRAAQELRQAGMSLLVGSCGVALAGCARWLPGARVFSIDSDFLASSLHAALHHLFGSPAE